MTGGSDPVSMFSVFSTSRTSTSTGAGVADGLTNRMWKGPRCPTTTLGQTSMINPPLTQTVRGAAVDAPTARASSADPCTVMPFMGAIRVRDLRGQASHAVHLLE